MELNNQINQLRLQQYASYLADQGLSDASIRRKLSSLTSFHKFLTKKKLVSSPRPTVRPTTAVTQATTPNPVSNIPPIPTQSRSPFFNRYFLIASIILLLSGLGYTLYTQVFNRANKNLAYSSASSPVTPNRILSFQGRLTDSFGNPISSSTGAVFKLYTLSTGGTELYTSGAGNSQTVIPDENGIFSVVIGKSHGLGIPSSVFSENAEVWLEITAGGETMNPRQQIATVGYALNSETLQGLPPSASGMKNTVLVIDGSGNLNLGETSPTIYSQSGTLGIIGQALLIGTSDGSGGNITINPDGAGKLRILTEGTGSTATGGFIEASNANLATGNLFSGYINNDNRGYNFLDFSNYNVGTTALSSRFSIDAYGNLASAGTINTSIGITTPRITISVGSSAGYILSSDASGNASWMSPASIGATYDSTNGITKSSNVFKLGGQITENTRLNIGNTEVLYISQSTGNVGIGTTDTTYKLQVSGGDVAIDNNKNFYWGSGATQTYLNVNSGIMNYYYSGTRQLEINLNPSSSNSILSFEGNLAIGTTATNSDLIFSPKRNAYLSSGNFGIGTTAPNYKLEVSGDALISTRLGIGSTNALYAFNVGGTSMLADIFGSSSLAIGTTAPTYKLELVGSNSLLRIGDTAGNTLVDISETSAQFNLPTTFTSTGDVNMANDLNFTNQTASTIRSNAPLYLEAGESFENNDLTLKTFNLGNVVLDTAGLTLLQAQSWTLATGTTNALNVSNGLISIDTLNSRVGIGTSSPTKKLDVTGDINLTGTIFANGTSGTSGQVLISTGTGLQWVPNVGTTYTFTNGITLTGSTVGLGGTLTQNTQIGTSSFHIDFIGLGGTQALRIDESGNIGIGGTSSVAKLDITGNTVIRGSLGVGGTNPGYGLSVSGTGDSGSIYASSYVISPGIRGTLYNGVTRIGMSSSDTVFQGYNGSIVEAFRYDGSGQLGVGITVPKAKLHVNGIGSSVIAIFDGSGNVGIGTTAPVEKLHVNGAIRLPKSQYIAWADGSAGDYADSITVSDSPSWLPKLNVQTFQVYDSSAASGAWVFRGSSTGNPIMTILANAGNVGIGTTAPSKKLDITGDINLTGTIFTNGTSGSNGQILTSTGVGLSWVPSSAVGATYTFTNGLTNTSGTVRIGGTLTQNTQIGTSSFNLSYLGSGGVQGLFLSSNGNVGIGHTNPLAKLVIEGTSNPEIRIYENTGNPGTYGALSLNANPFDNTVWAQLRGVVTSANDAEISFLTTSDAGSNLTEKMRLSSTGSLGIGTTSPTKKLDVAGDINLTGTIFANGSSGSSGQVLSSTGTGLQWISNVGSTYTFSNGLTLTGSTVRIGGTLTQNTDIGTSSFSLNIGHGSTLAMYISSGGAVGFGTNVVSGGKVTVDGGNMNISTGYAYAIGSSPFMSYRNNAALILNENSTAQSIGMYGNVGIGTTAPISKLYVVGTGSSHIAIFNGSGNVGIGTTNPTHNFEIAGTDNNFYFDKAGGLLVTNSNALGSLAEFRGYDSNSSYFDANANLYITTGKGIAVDTIASYSTNALMSINSQGSGNLTLQNTSTGNVGIGTSNPTKKLSVAGDINLTGTIFANGTSGSSGQVLSSTGTGLQWVAAGAGSTYTFTNGLTNTSGTVRIGGTLTQNTQIGTSSFSLSFLGLGNSQSLFIGASGYVGIGTTNPAKKLDVAGDIKLTGTIFVGAGVTGSSGQILASDGAGGLQWVNDAGGTGGVGTTYTFTNGLTNTSGTVRIGGTLTQNTQIGTSSFSLSFLGLGNSQSLFIGASGYVGIGTTNPTHKLDLYGSANDYLGYIYNVGTTTNTAGLYVRSDGLGSLLTLNSGGTDIVTITATQTTFNNPVNFTSSGDVSAGYDLVFTNNSSSSIRSSAPLSIQSGEVFNSSNLTLTTYNSGQLVLDTPGGVTLNQAQNWTLGNGSTSTTALNIQSGLLNIDTTNSRIGIGTTAPSKKLDIAGDINLTGTIFTTGTTGASGQVLSSNGAGGLSWITPGGATYYANNGLTMTGTTVGLGGTMITNTTIGTSSFSLLFTGLGGTQALFVGSSGYVGVGTTAPISPLSVNGNITASKFASIFDYSRYFADPGNSTSTNGSVSLHGNGSITFNTETVGTTQVAISANASSRIKSFANGLSIATNIGSTGVGSTINWNETLFVGTSGFVSIGSTSQLGSLGIVNDGNLGIVIDSSDSNPSRLNFGINTSVGAWFNSTATGSGTTLPFVFATQGIERFRIATNGAVGFGTTSPLGVFEVKVNGTGGTSALNIAANGKVGIGTSSAALYQLDVRGTNSSGVAFFRNLQTGNTVPTMLVQTASTGLGTTGGEYIRFVNSTGAKVGRIRIGTAVTAVVYGTNGTNDLAEYQIANEPTDAADLISFDNGKYSRYTPGSTIAGIHSSYATLVGNESLIDQPNAFPLAISGIVKLKVSTQNGPIHQGDPLTGSNIIATASKAVKPGYIVARALESYTNPDPSQVGTIEVIIGLNWYDPDVFLTESGEVNVNHNISDAVLSSLGYTASKNEIESATYSLSNSLGQPVTRLAQFAQISSAKIKAGLVSTTNLIAKNIIAETTKSKEVKTAVLTPLSDITDTIVVDGKLAASDIQTTSVTTDRLTASEATVSTLYAENIISKEGSFGQVMTDKIAALREEIRSTIASIGTTDPISTPSALVAEVPNWTFDNGTSQTIIEGSMNLSDNLVVGAKLSVLGDTQLGNAFITGTFTAGEVAIKENFIETTASVLHIQPSGLGSVNVMNNTLVIAENGEVTVNGNLAVSGNINSTSLFANLINADEINTKKLTTESVNVATASATPIIAESGFAALATSSASLATNATAGSATLPAGKTELVIYNTKVTSNSIIYLTPAGSTGNQVVYLKSKYISPTPSPTTSPEATSSATSGSSFTIAIDQPLSADTNINWWIIN